MKRKLIILLTLCAVCTLFTLSATAKTISKDIYSGETVTQTLGEDDICRYSFETDKDGFYTLDIKSVTSNSSASPTIKVSALKGGSVVSEFDTDRSFTEGKYQMVEGFEKGTITFRITNTTKFSDVTYVLEFKFREYDYVEYESNNTQDKATHMELTKAYTGGVLKTDDFDWYAFDVEKDGYIVLSMVCDEQKYFSLYNEDMVCLGDITFLLSDMTKSYDQRIGVTAGKYYVRVSSYDDMTKPKYTFRVTAFGADGFESEYNDTRESADVIAFSTEYKGNLTTSTDEDYYRFSLSENDNLTLKFTDSYLTKNGHYSLYIEDENGKAVAEKIQFSTSEMSFALEKGIYFLHVICPSDKYFSGMSYRFTLSSEKTHTANEVTPTPDIPDVPDCTVPSFTDVTPEFWYYNDVESAKYYGLVDGVGDGKFDPDGNVTLAQVLTIASRLHKASNGIDFDFDGVSSDVWYTGYVIYAVSAGLIGQDDFDDYERSATRAEIAYIFSNVLDDGFEIVNDVSVLPDVDESTKYSESIFRLYRAGVLFGNDEDGTFFPDSLVTRAECAAMAVRLHNVK